MARSGIISKLAGVPKYSRTEEAREKRREVKRKIMEIVVKIARELYEKMEKGRENWILAMKKAMRAVWRFIKTHERLPTPDEIAEIYREAETIY